MTDYIDLLIISSPVTSNEGRNGQKKPQKYGFFTSKSYGLWGIIELWGLGSFLAPTELVDTKNVWGFTDYGLRLPWVMTASTVGRLNKS